MMRTNNKAQSWMLVTLALCAFGWAGTARAQELEDGAKGDDATVLPDETTEPDAAAEPEVSVSAEVEGDKGSGAIGVDVALKVGGTFHTLFNDLSPFVLFELEVGMTFLNKRLEVDLGAAWARPPASSASDDPRFEGDDYSWKIQQDFLTLSLLARFRFFEGDSLFNIYAGGGPRLYMLRTVADGKASGEAFGETRQYESRFGGVIVAGPELRLGPGAVGLEIAFGMGNLDGLITGDTSALGLDVLLGYRLMF